MRADASSESEAEGSAASPDRRTIGSKAQGLEAKSVALRTDRDRLHTVRRTVVGFGGARRSLSLFAVWALGVCLSPPALAAPGADRWLSAGGWDADRLARALAGYNDANNGFNFDGYGRGMLLVRVPLGWRVVVRCKNAASLRHSCASLGTATTATAFPGAEARCPLLGLLGGQTARFAFTASRAGSYRITCLVPGDEQARMWDLLEVGGVRRPSISTRTGF